MLLIILLGVLAKLAVVCADSNIDTVTIKTSERTNVSYPVTPPNYFNMKMCKH
jgi:hypothetical protein